MKLLNRKILRICLLFIFISCNTSNNKLQNEETSSQLIYNLIENSNKKELSKGERALNLSNALNNVDKIDDSSIKVNMLLEIAKSYYYLNNYEQLKHVNERALKLSVFLKDSIGMARSYGYKAIPYRNKKLDSAYKYFYKASKIYNKLDKNNNIDPSSYAFDHGRTLLDLAKLSRKVQDYSESEAQTINAIKKFELSKDVTYIPLSYNNLGLISKASGRYNDAINYYLKAMKYANNTSKDTLYRAISHHNIGTVYKSKKKYDKAIEYFDKALSYKRFLSTKPKRYARYIDNLGYTKFLSNKGNDSVFYLLNKAYQIRDSINDVDGLSTNSFHLAEYYRFKGNLELSKEFAKKAIQWATSIKDNTELLQAYDLLAQVSPPEEGRQYAMKYIKLSDSLTKRDNLFRDKFARIRFESDNLQKENEQKNKEIEEVQNQNTIYLLGMLLLVTFIAFIIYFSRQRTRYLAQQNKIVEFQAAYETETRISKRLHDELGNDIFQVMMQYQNDPHDPQITKKLNTAYNKARDISRENSEFEVDETYTEELTDMLTNYTENHSKLILRGIDKISWNDVDKNLKITIYRVLQELMTNMQKHSQADLVAIVFKNEKKKLLIKYSDNGVGIEQEDIKSKNGLRNTEKRVQAIQGNITFDSAKDKGFKAEIKIPV
ncbi:tetratricopeptide repeat-containing sensor histidine kinase [Aquimarina litoralis]|uniref:tetratricopeptide repeat-containing sensor histidine kinase n=1 Tax=Aquimarina litoralis TaxID=584605 RepID=UPI001C57AC98|nr:tetratricopeptide repeat protein [Aquimarina litoralis]MBW1297860.1 tetratricopeptide repeat protein [Aquimarina litoralis]